MANINVSCPTCGRVLNLVAVLGESDSAIVECVLCGYRTNIPLSETDIEYIEPALSSAMNGTSDISTTTN